MESVGCPTWFEIGQSFQDAAASGDRQKHVDHLIGFFSTTDCGSDQVYCGKLINAILKGSLQILNFRSKCYIHQAHLITKSGLDFVDDWLKNAGLPWRYYSSLAKMSNCCREKVRVIFLLWVKFHGAKDAVHCAKRVPPKCIYHRELWGSQTPAQIQQSFEHI